MREFVKINTGDTPENLPKEMPLTDMKKSLKEVHKELQKATEEDLEEGSSTVPQEPSGDNAGSFHSENSFS